MGTRRDEILDETIKNIASAPDEITYSRDRPVDKTIKYRDEKSKSKQETSKQATDNSDSNQADTKNNKDDPFDGCLSSEYADDFGDRGGKGEGKKKSKK